MKSNLDIRKTMTNRMNNDEIVGFYKLNFELQFIFYKFFFVTIIIVDFIRFKFIILDILAYLAVFIYKIFK